mmetsp:Transcript_71468/g.198397  ORF Transcript_71468/g.198397 Transcript_71468/m.198397 type:complete len:217 (-) Transcript_71468:15-665(-)
MSMPAPFLAKDSDAGQSLLSSMDAADAPAPARPAHSSARPPPHPTRRSLPQSSSYHSLSHRVAPRLQSDLLGDPLYASIVHVARRLSSSPCRTGAVSPATGVERLNPMRLLVKHLTSASPPDSYLAPIHFVSPAPAPTTAPPQRPAPAPGSARVHAPDTIPETPYFRHLVLVQSSRRTVPVCRDDPCNTSLHTCTTLGSGTMHKLSRRSREAIPPS